LFIGKDDDDADVQYSFLN